MVRKRLAAGAYRDVLTGKTISLVERDGESLIALEQAFSHLPLALLVNVEQVDKDPDDAE